MNKENQRISISEACGEGHHHLRNLPDYLNDLNAMHEAEKIIWEHINPIIPFTFEWHLDDMGVERIAHATAAQRAEAFLKTLNLWI